MRSVWSAAAPDAFTLPHEAFELDLKQPAKEMSSIKMQGGVNI